MKTYRITVNGTAYDVVVEEVENGAVPAAPAAPKAPVAPAPAPAPVKKAAPASAGGIKVVAPMPGKILDVKVSAGTAVKRGQVVMILEAMKMENEIVAPEDGVIASVEASAGAAVEAGDVLATMN